jgi:hypothetical protein
VFVSNADTFDYAGHIKFLKAKGGALMTPEILIRDLEVGFTLVQQAFQRV